MARFSGADPDELEELARVVGNESTRIHQVEAVTNGLVNGVVWMGADADRFAAEWRGTMRPQLLAAQHLLEEMDRALRVHAAEQLDASGTAVSAQDAGGAFTAAAMTGLATTGLAAGFLGRMGQGYSNSALPAVLRVAELTTKALAFSSLKKAVVGPYTNAWKQATKGYQLFKFKSSPVLQGAHKLFGPHSSKLLRLSARVGVVARVGTMLGMVGRGQDLADSVRSGDHASTAITVAEVSADVLKINKNPWCYLAGSAIQAAAEAGKAYRDGSNPVDAFMKDPGGMLSRVFL